MCWLQSCERHQFIAYAASTYAEEGVTLNPEEEHCLSCFLPSFLIVSYLIMPKKTWFKKKGKHGSANIKQRVCNALMSPAYQ